MKKQVVEFGKIITINEQMINLIEKAKKIAESNINILVMGENGIGRKLLACEIHEYSFRKDHKFMAVNCSDAEEKTLERELFGYEKGSFEQAMNRQVGKIEQANKGTIFLDSISKMPLSIQTKILNLLETKEMQRIGGEEKIPIDVRVIVGGNVNLVEEVKKKKIIQDLYFKLNEISFTIPALRERKEDIPILIDYFIFEFNKEFNKNIEGISQVGLHYLLNYNWPGNIRELKGLIRTAVAISEKKLLWLEDIPLKISVSSESTMEESPLTVLSLKQVEKEHILRILHMCRWNKSKAAKLLEISRPRLDRKIEDYHLVKLKKR